MQKDSMTLPMFDAKTCQKTLTCLLEDSHVKHLAKQGSDWLLKTPEGHSFMKSYGFSNITSRLKSPSNILYSKMLKAYIVQEITQHLVQSIAFSPTLVIPLSVNCLIVSSSESHKTGRGSISLVDILQEEVDQKYFLSASQVERIRKAEEEKAKLEKDKADLAKRLGKHDIGNLAENKPGLVERIINGASKSAARCVEIASGSPLTEEELNGTPNRECPSFWPTP